MHELWPPIDVVRERLGQPPTALSGDLHDFSASDPVLGDTVTIALPELVQARIRQISAAKILHADWPRPGLVLRVGKVGICLNHPIPGDAHAWSGWLTAPDTDYATDADVLLEESDEPFDPYASMVLTGHPITIHVSMPLHVLAILSPERLEAIRAVAGEQRDRSTPAVGGAAPGRVYLRGTPTGVSALTGTPIGNAADPRHSYATLYRQYSEQLVASTQSMRQTPSIVQAVGAWLLSHRFRSASVVAAALVLAITISVLRQAPDEVHSIPQLAQAPASPALPTSENTPSSAPLVDATKQDPAPAPATATTPESPPASSVMPQPVSAPSVTVKPPSVSPTQPKHNGPIQLAEITKPDPAPERPDTSLTSPKHSPAPILLASLDEGLANIAVTRTATSSDMLTRAPTHILRVVSVAALPKAKDLLRTLGIQSAVISSDVAALYIVLPPEANLLDIDQHLVASELFVPRTDWLRRP